MTESIITNSLTQAVAKNYFDGGKKYYYRITDDGDLEYKIGTGDWETFDYEVNKYFKDICPDCKIDKIKNVAADNNRVFILTTDNKLYWRCLLEDSASWVLFIFNVAELIGSTYANELIWPYLKDKKYIEGKPYNNLKDWASSYRTWVEQTHKSVEEEKGWNPLVGRTWKINDNKPIEYDEFIKYNDILDIAVGNWNNTVITYYVLARSCLFRLNLNYKQYPESGEVNEQLKRAFMDEGIILSSSAEVSKINENVWEIKDVADSYRIEETDEQLNIYAKSKKTEQIKIFFLDEEAIMQEWEEVPDQNMISLDQNSKICASHSVIAATCGNKIHWIRFDAHTNDHIPFWPLNWTEKWVDLPKDLPYDQLLEYFSDEEPPFQPDTPIGRLILSYPPFDVLDKANYPGWHTVEAPTESICGFLIDVAYGGVKPWPVPKPFVDQHHPLLSAISFFSVAWKLYFIIAAYSAVMDEMRGVHSEVGFLGENPIKPNCNYPVCCIIKIGDNNYNGFFIHRSTDEVEWKGDINESSSSFIGGKFKEGMAEICDWADNLENSCREWKEGVCRDLRHWEDGVCEDLRHWEDGVCRDVGGYDCCDWAPCSWFCDTLVWVANIVCEAGTWVTDRVCEAGTWVTGRVCEAGTWVINSLCKAFTGGIKKMTCWARPCWKK